ncbi:hypothetical protein CI102_11099 [Trichoderma harzianum]|nr:hypothetical protein CI102_11099 [Trichoderma harzianum]
MWLVPSQSHQTCTLTLCHHISELTSIDCALFLGFGSCSASSPASNTSPVRVQRGLAQGGLDCWSRKLEIGAWSSWAGFWRLSIFFFFLRLRTRVARGQELAHHYRAWCEILWSC